MGKSTISMAIFNSKPLYNLPEGTRGNLMIKWMEGISATTVSGGWLILGDASIGIKKTQHSDSITIDSKNSKSN